MPGKPPRPLIRVNPHALWVRLDVLNMTQNELAGRAGLTSDYISLLVGGKRRPSPDARRRLMEALSVTDFHYLFIVEDCDGP